MSRKLEDIGMKVNSALPQLGVKTSSPNPAANILQQINLACEKAHAESRKTLKDIQEELKPKPMTANEILLDQYQEAEIKLEVLAALYGGAEKRNDELFAENEKLKTENENLKAENAELKTTVDTVNALLDNEVAVNKKAKSEIAVLIAWYNMAEKRRGELFTENALLKSAHDELIEKNSCFKQGETELIQKNNELEAERERVFSQMADMESKLDYEIKSNVNLLEQIKNLKAENANKPSHHEPHTAYSPNIPNPHMIKRPMMIVFDEKASESEFIEFLKKRTGRS